MSSFQFECAELNLQIPTEYYGRFVFNTLEPGQGITIGNILRRILLRNLTGLAIVGVRIAGINNEFATISGVREDTLELLLNLKEIVFKKIEKKIPPLFQQQPICRFRIAGPAIVTASSFKLPPDISIVNPNQYIATISDSSILEMEIILDYGKGYILAENKSIDKKKFIKSIDLINVDAVFMPVKRVGFNIETSFSELLGMQEKLILEIWTNGSMTPSESMSLATNIVIDWFSQIHESDISSITEIKKSTIVENIVIPEEKNINNIKIETLNLSSRAYKTLKQANINTIGELVKYNLRSLQNLKNFGKKSMEEVTNILYKNYKITLS